jgi:hydroxyacylglutathione hydrolase
MERVIVMGALSDNFEYILTFGQNKAIVIDPAGAFSVLQEIKKRNLQLVAVLATHHHYDHTAGVKSIAARTNCKAIQGGRGLKDGQVLEFDGCKIRVITTPGHTNDSVCFYVEPSKEGEGILFAGDTLFIAGCGRPIEGDAKSMWNSLEKLAALPDDTLVYPGHDYTEDNCGFGLTIEPGNKDIQELREEVKKNGGKSVVPSTIGREKKINVFLRAGLPEVKALIDHMDASNETSFAEIRGRKNRYE